MTDNNLEPLPGAKSAIRVVTLLACVAMIAVGTLYAGGAGFAVAMVITLIIDIAQRVSDKGANKRLDEERRHREMVEAIKLGKIQ